VLALKEEARMAGSLPWRLAVKYVNGPAPHYAPAIAFNAFVAIFPIIVGVVSLLLLLFPGQNVPRQVDRLLVEAFPLGTRREISLLLREIPKHLQTAAIISLLAMVWSGTALFSCLGGALNAVHGTRGRNVFRQRVMGLRLFGVLAVAVSVMLLLDSLSDRLPHHPAVGALVALAPLTLLMAFIYRVAAQPQRPDPAAAARSAGRSHRHRGGDDGLPSVLAPLGRGQHLRAGAGPGAGDPFLAVSGQSHRSHRRHLQRGPLAGSDSGGIRPVARGCSTT
jgi:uncharacterized BrkB/YihY/UPF0761 family membrane protein